MHYQLVSNRTVFITNILLSMSTAVELTFSASASMPLLTIVSRSLVGLLYRRSTTSRVLSWTVCRD